MTLGALVVAVAVMTGAAAPSRADTGSAIKVKPTQELAVLFSSHQVFSAPDARATRVSTLRSSRPVTGGQTVVPIVGRRTANDGVHWLQVMVPGRPNGAHGWVKRSGTLQTKTSWHVVVRTSSRRLLVYRRGGIVRSFPSIVGKRSTPTPHGRFFVEESVRLPRGEAGAPFALALSARSTVLQEFAGGPGQIAVHGMSNIGGNLGTASSHGCVRVADGGIRWLAARITPGVPVSIVP